MDLNVAEQPEVQHTLYELLSSRGIVWAGGPGKIPRWNEAGRVHDWRNHIPSVLRALWPRMSVEARLVAIYMAEQLSDREEWD